MRPILLPILGAVLSLGVSGTRTSCDSKHESATFSSARILSQVTEYCITDFCATRGNNGIVTRQCGPIVLTITPLTGGVLLSDTGDCISQFQNIIIQCIATNEVLGGASQTDQLVYDVFVDESEGESDRHTLEARRGGRSTTRKKPAAVPKKKTRIRKGKSRPKTTPKKGTTAKTKPRPKAEKKPKACPLPENNKVTKRPKVQSSGVSSLTKSNKIIRDIENFVPVPRVAKRALIHWLAGQAPPKNTGKGKGKATAGGGGKKKKEPVAEDCVRPYDKWYKEHTLYDNGRSKKVMWWMFRRSSGWNSKVPTRSKAHKIITDMRTDGKFDVIQIKGGHMYAAGNPGGEHVHGVQYTDYTTRPNDMLIINGGFFKHKGSDLYAAVGETSTTDLVWPLPVDYAEHYEMIQGEDNTFIQSGPGLMQPLEMRDKKWLYTTDTSNIVGSLSHATQANERLALAIAKNGDKFVFVYTADARAMGKNMRGWRDLIIKWFKVWHNMELEDLDQLVNLDGGRSINVVWKAMDKPAKRIAQGGIGDRLPGSKSTHPDPIKVANLLLFSPSNLHQNEEESDPEPESELEDETAAGPVAGR